MYQILENPQMMTREEIREQFIGRWVYLVNTEYTFNELLIRGVPVVVSDSPFEGVEDSIYDIYDDRKYGAKTSYNLIDNHDFIPFNRCADTAQT